jgi:hypothetical protein
MVLTLAALVALSYKIIPLPKKRAWVLVSLAVAVMAKFLGREFELGQVNILIILLLTAMSALFLAKKDIPAGIVWALSLLFKPYALVFLPYFALKKRFKVLASGFVSILVGLLLPALVYGLRGNWAVLKEWISSLSQSTPGLLTVGDNASLFAFVLKLFQGRWSPAAIGVLSLATLAVGVGFLLMIYRRKAADLRTAEVTELAFLFVLIPLFSPLGWYYNYLYGFLAVMILLNRLGEFRAGLKWTAIVNFCIIGGTLREVLGKTLFRYYTHHSLATLNFLAVLALLVVLQVSRNRRAS